MSDIDLDPVTSGYKFSKINTNFTKLENSVNNDLLHRDGGNNVMSQNIDMNSNRLLNVTPGTNPGDLVNKQYIDDADALKYDKAGGAISGDVSIGGKLDMGGSRIEGVGTPNTSTDAANRDYVDDGLNTKFDKLGGTISGNTSIGGTLEMNDNRVTGVSSPIAGDDAVPYGTLLNLIADGGGSNTAPLTNPRQIADGVATQFSSPATQQYEASAFFVHLDGVRQQPTLDYTIDASGNIIFVEAPPQGTAVDVTLYTPVFTELGEGLVLDRKLDSWHGQQELTYNTVAEAKADVLLTVGQKVKTAGYYSANDGGGAEYIVVAGGSGADDGGSYHDMDNSNQLKLITGGIITDSQFGIVSDASSDQSTQVNRFLNNTSGEVEFTVSDIRLGSPVTVNNPDLVKVVSRSNTTIKPTLANTGSGTMLFTFRTAIDFSGFIIDGDQGNQTELRNVLVGFQAEGVHIHSCSFRDILGISIIYSESNDCSVRLCDFTDVGSYQNLAGSSSTRKPAINITSNTPLGISGFVVEKCTFNNVGLDCVLVRNAVDIKVSEVTTNFCGAASVYIKDSDQFTVSDIIANDCAAPQVPTANSLDIPGSSNGVISNIVSARSGGSAVGLFEDCEQVSVSNVVSINAHASALSPFDAAVTVSGDASVGITVDNIASVNDAGTQSFGVLLETNTPQIVLGSNISSTGHTVNKVGFKNLYRGGAPSDFVVTGNQNITISRFGDSAAVGAETVTKYVNAYLQDGSTMKIAVLE